MYHRKHKMIFAGRKFTILLGDTGPQVLKIEPEPDGVKKEHLTRQVLVFFKQSLKRKQKKKDGRDPGLFT